MRDEQRWLRSIDVAVGLAALGALAYGLSQLPGAGQWGAGVLAVAGVAVVFACPVAVVVGRRDHRMLLESPVLIPVALLLPPGTAVIAAAAGMLLGTGLRTHIEHLHDARATTLRTTGTFVASVALMAALAERLSPVDGEWLLAAVLLEVVHLAVVLPVPLLRARVNQAPRGTTRWRQLLPSLVVAPLTALTAGAIVLLVDVHGPVGLAAYAPVVLLLLGGQRLTAAQQDRRRLDALYALALDTAEADSDDDAFGAATVAARQVFAGAEITLATAVGGPRDASFELAPGRWLVASRRTDGFTPDDRDLLAAVGRLATTSAHRALLHQELARQERIKTALLAAAGHDLQTPLAIQQGIADTLAMHRDALDPEQTEDLVGRIASNARRMSRTIAGLVDLERLELSDAPGGGCDAASAIAAWADEAELPNGRYLKLQVSGEGATPVALECIHLERVVENLVANASRYSPREEPITIRVERDDDEVLVAVEDRGAGVPHADRERIFEALDQGTSRIRGSVGLGLFIVSRLVEHGRGSVTVHDRDGGGASFQVRLPLLGAHADPTEGSGGAGAGAVSGRR